MELGDTRTVFTFQGHPYLFFKINTIDEIYGVHVIGS